MPEPEIANVYPLVHNKVLSPHFVNPTLRRARLIDWLNEHATCRAMVIAADAGYGKTTLVWQWEREVPFDCYWYKLDRNDRDWSLQISYLIEAVSQRHEGFGRRTNSMLQQIGAASATGRATVTAYLISELNERLREPATFIVDDWQFVASVTEVRAFWNQMLRDAPANCRFLFLARAKPQLQFARFTTHAGYAELRTDALRFNEEEIRLLFEEVYRDPLDPQELVEIERRTEGWAASLQLIEVSLRERKTPEERRAFIESITATRDSDLFNFLAEEVLDQQTDQTRNFLLCTSILTQITPELAERMTGVVDGRRLLNELEQRGLFTYRLDPETIRYRYHGLFRDFLERCLKQERTEAEVVGLHIHAASYYETTSQWPDAIHHYLAAGLTSQASRLIARYGEDVVAGGRLGLVDEWLQQIPQDAIRSNARLSLLWGETLGMRGDWKPALATLERARKFFHRKGDARMEALSCVKLSNVLTAHGELDRAAAIAEEGLSLVPDDAEDVRLRLEGNLAVTKTWLQTGLPEVARVCRRIAIQASRRGWDHFVAIARHNVGLLDRRMGRLAESRRNLELAAAFWEELGKNPHSDNAELVQTLLGLGDVDAAETYADRALRNTAPWQRPFSEAVISRASVDLYKGDFAGARQRLEPLLDDPEWMGALSGTARATLIEAYYLEGTPRQDVEQAERILVDLPSDPRDEPANAVTDAIAAHILGRCRGGCSRVHARLDYWSSMGATRDRQINEVRLAVLAIDHDREKASAPALAALKGLPDPQTVRYMRHWVRRLLPLLPNLAAGSDGAVLVEQLLQADPEFWREHIARILPLMDSGPRQNAITQLGRFPSKSLVQALSEVEGDDVADLRRSLIQAQAARVFVRTFGRMQLHRGSWDASPDVIGRQRSRLLLGLLIAYQDRSLTRDAVLELLWPESSASAATNSLNQTVYMLRRSFEPNYRDGETPPYIESTADLVSLQSHLVATDLDEFRRLGARLRESPAQHVVRDAIERMVGLIRGEFLADLRYEDWVGRVQPQVHAEIRHTLLPVASAATSAIGDDLAIRAASALISLDEFDEQAYLAIAERLSSSGRRIAAREVITRYARKLRAELDEPPSADLVGALKQLGVPVSIHI